ncbi:hypothetical protein BKA82DRAFT_4113327, partial [Pisolithus tinctorius]
IKCWKAVQPWKRLCTTGLVILRSLEPTGPECEGLARRVLSKVYDFCTYGAKHPSSSASYPKHSQAFWLRVYLQTLWFHNQPLSIQSLLIPHWMYVGSRRCRTSADRWQLAGHSSEYWYTCTCPLTSNCRHTCTCQSQGSMANH